MKQRNYIAKRMFIERTAFTKVIPSKKNKLQKNSTRDYLDEYEEEMLDDLSLSTDDSDFEDSEMNDG